MKKLIINLAPTGIIPVKQMTPHVPIHPEEIVADVLKCAELGASIVHLHARDGEEKATYKKDIYGSIIHGIRSVNKDLVIVVSTSGRVFGDFEQRSEVLNLEEELRPDMASLTLGSLNFYNKASSNSPSMIAKLAEKMLECDIKPELEVFDLGMVNFAHYLIKKELLKPPYYFNILLGNIATAQAKLMHLGLIVSELPEQSIWSVAGIGSYQKQMSALGVTLADGVRIGLEDNLWEDDSRTHLASNVTLVQRVVNLAQAMERPIATPQDVRSMLFK
ncbi:uncharacterized protein (DUF849 family) [Aneurinibacillus soli]|uniref:3-keto-5-aminohexanoate cleavage enzyme n=1 Tax=Aneurinibacillus soli TaxID=1500254 RepID=A0A0U5ART2_9BACL|nr:3-keto-5-aminohexanoate cleavage protein [Aneurinibacillus soli]PYE61532.1 uncharacterized protein (DUF849 family) [Aneurinibacillus soli]BAU26513.1 3-keto-5-aminohexanoate cleavage enzyme [Aneurinibacillus soli]